jgi:hypothetical protein
MRRGQLVEGEFLGIEQSPEKVAEDRVALIGGEGLVSFARSRSRGSRFTVVRKSDSVTFALSDSFSNAVSRPSPSAIWRWRSSLFCR